MAALGFSSAAIASNGMVYVGCNSACGQVTTVGKGVLYAINPAAHYDADSTTAADPQQQQQQQEPQGGQRCVTDAGPWPSYTVSLQFKRGHPASVAAKTAVQQALCTRFHISPCAVSKAASTELYFVRDGDLNVPAAHATAVTFFAMQYSTGVVHGAPGGYNLDVMIYPNTNCPGLDVAEHAVHIGHKSPFNTNLLPSPAAASPSSAPDPDVVPAGRSTTSPQTPQSPGASSSGNVSMFYSCSSDATCYPPFAPGTGCTGDALQTAAHFHFYYVDNDPAMLTAVLRFVASLESTFGISHTVCPDNFGHEEPHNHSCW
jgi:hypothetical protein